MNDYISRDDVLKAIDYQHEVNNVFESEAAYVQMWETINDDIGIKSADVQPVNRGKWCKPLMGQGKCSTYCSRCFGTVMRNTTGIFEETPFCPHCGAKMLNE